jgi:MFS family permease
MTLPPDAPAQRPWLALSGTMAVQLLASLCLSAAAVMAPVVAPSLGIAPSAVGVFVGCAYLFAMVVGLGSGGWVPRWGAMRVSQAAMGVIALGMAAATAGQPLALLLAAVLVGAGYGCTNPAAAALLAFHAPARSPGLFFSLKQAAVPIGVTLAGLLLPVGLALFGWRATAWLAVLACILVVIWFGPLAARLEPPRGDAVRPAGPGWLSSLRQAVGAPALRRLSLMSLAYAMTQQGFLTFVVSLLHLQLGVPLAAAAGLLAASQVGSTLMRVALGHVADRWVRPRLLLAGIGLLMSLGCLALGLLPTSASLPLLALVVVACGTTAAGWNGVFFAELVRNVRREDMAATAGGTQFFTFAGGMAGPLLFSQLVRWTDSYASGYLLLAAVSALAAAGMLLPVRRQSAVVGPAGTST